MGMTVTRASDSVHTPSALGSVKVRMVGAHPDLLSRGYKQLRRFPAAIAFLICWSASRQHHLPSLQDVAQTTFSVWDMLFVLALLCIWSMAFKLHDEVCRAGSRLRFLASESVAVLWGTLFSVVLLATGRYALHVNALQLLSVPLFVGLCLLHGEALVLLAALLYEAVYRMADSSLYLIVGSRSRAIEAFEGLQSHGKRRGNVLGFMDTSETINASLPAEYLGSLDHLEQVLATHPVDMVYLTLPLRSHHSTMQEAIWSCERLGVNYCCSPSVFETSAEQDHLVMRDVHDAVRGHEDIRLVVKRTVDVLAAGSLLVLLAPVLAITAAAVKLTSPGPVLFRQQRYGRNRRKFAMIKFRSMVADAERQQASVEQANEVSGPIFKAKADPRITPLGKWLRRLSLDELPQLLNVLKGDMSLVGPRPMSIRDVHRFAEPWLMRRFSVTPGMTGLWQVSGRSNLNFDSWIKLDMQYIDHWSLILDLKILVRTVRTVLLCEGAH